MYHMTRVSAFRKCREFQVNFIQTEMLCYLYWHMMFSDRDVASQHADAGEDEIIELNGGTYDVCGATRVDNLIIYLMHPSLAALFQHKTACRYANYISCVGCSDR